MRPKINLSNLLDHMFSMDLRSLALMRITMGILLLGDLISRIPYLTFFYADAGALPRRALMSFYSSNLPLSLHMGCGSAIGEAVLFLAAGFFAFNVLIGRRTQLFTFLSWAMLLSLNNRNPFILNSGDRYITLILFICIFLPWGQKFSVDSKNDLHKESGPAIASLATVAYIMQVICIYLFTGVLKSKSVWWTSGDAMYFALSIEEIVKPMAHQLLAYPHFLHTLSLFIPKAEVGLPFILLVPFFNYSFRLAAILCFVLFHAGIWIAYSISFFVPQCLIPLIGLLPPIIWDGYKHIPPFRPKTNIAVSLCLVFFMVACLTSNLQSIGIRTPRMPVIDSLSRLVDFNQNWVMFVAMPTYACRYSLEKTLKDGSHSIEPIPKEERLRNMIVFIKRSHQKHIGDFWGDYSCRQTEGAKSIQLIETIIPIIMASSTQPIEKDHIIFNYRCH